MSRVLYVFLPPSEAKADGGEEYGFDGDFSSLAGARQSVVAELAHLIDASSTRELEKTLGVRGPLLERALVATRALVNGEAGTTAAWQRYTGIVWSHLDAATLTSDQRARLLVPSGLYGVTSGLDPVADYRLKMNCSLGSLGRLSAYWKPMMINALADHLRDSIVVDLLPREHEVAIDFERLGESCEVHHISFVRHDGARAAGHDAKAVKGEVARHLLVSGVDGLDGFRWSGWRARVRHGHVRIVAPRK